MLNIALKREASAAPKRFEVSFMFQSKIKHNSMPAFETCNFLQIVSLIFYQIPTEINCLLTLLLEMLFFPNRPPHVSIKK